MSELEIYKGMVKKMKDDEIKEMTKVLKSLGNKQASELYYYITNLQQENERLKETNVYCNRTDCVGRIKDSKKYDSVYQEKEDYKSRIEKAVEYLKKHIEKCNIDGYEGKFDNFDIFTKPQELLNILNGRSDE